MRNAKVLIQNFMCRHFPFFFATFPFKRTEAFTTGEPSEIILHSANSFLRTKSNGEQQNRGQLLHFSFPLNSPSIDRKLRTTFWSCRRNKNNFDSVAVWIKAVSESRGKISHFLLCCCCSFLFQFVCKCWKSKRKSILLDWNLLGEDLFYTFSFLWLLLLSLPWLLIVFFVEKVVKIIKTVHLWALSLVK